MWPTEDAGQRRFAAVVRHGGCFVRGSNIPDVIDRDQVLHVARLARLRLAEDEIDTMSRELSTVLDHIEKISELDLEGVAPTSHVVEVENVMRPDEPRPSWPRERVLAEAPDAADDGFRVPTAGR